MPAPPSDYRYTVEGELLTQAEIVERVLRDHPRLKVNTIHNRIRAGARTWRKLGEHPAVGQQRRRQEIKRVISSAFKSGR